MQHLVFTLYAPYGAWGAASASSATTAYKATELEPSRSAVIGLLGAALGRERARLPELDRALFVAVREVLAPRRDPKPDYHTVTPARRPNGRERWTRFEELRPHLAGNDKQGGSILSRREYWTNGLWTVALARSPAEGPSLKTLAEALSRPVWLLYGGRKACGLGLPPDPEVIAAHGPVEALAAYGLPWTRRPALAAILAPLADAVRTQTGFGRLLYDAAYPGAPDPPLRTVARRDRTDHLLQPSGRLFRRYLTRIQAELPWPGEVPA
jgi:CRISPR system Cascade subunit CasD